MIKLNNVNKYYNKNKQNEIHVINDVSLELPEKGIVAIFGKSGCGKTTLLNVIGGLDKFHDGTITIEENNITENPDVIRNKYIGYIFQNYNLNKNETCAENVANSLKLCGITDNNEIERRVDIVLKNVGMEKYKKRLPDSLSGGQQQRIAIARALVKNPKIILADEPTGNLDENNTIMIMELLKEIAKEHLVLLVTHEENLVEYYANQIINITDGQITSVVDNISSETLNIKNKNDIYLGEFNKTILTNETTNIDYYGEALDQPIKLTVVNDSGKIYLKINTPNVKVLDATSEVKLKEGTYIQKESKSFINNINFDELPLIEGDKFGRLFTFTDSVKSAFINNFSKKRRRRQKSLHILLGMFAAVIVLFTAVFSTAFGQIKNISDAYNHYMFYVKADTTDISNILNNGLTDGSSGIEDVQLTFGYPYQEDGYSFDIGTFESSQSNYNSSVYVQGICLDNTLIKDHKVKCGTIDNLEPNHLVITTAFADELIKKAYVSYIQSYEDLIGVICERLAYDNKSCYIVGIVESNERVIYVDPIVNAKRILKTGNINVSLGQEYNKDINPGEVIFITRNDTPSIGEPIVGKIVDIHGKSFKVSEIVRCYKNYDSWLKNFYPSLNITRDDYIKNLMKELYPDVAQNSVEYDTLFYETFNKYYYDYLSMYFQKMDDYLNNSYLFNKGDYLLWLYFEKQYEIAKYGYFSIEGLELLYALDYKEEHGSFPVYSEETSLAVKTYVREHERIQETHYEEFYRVYIESFYGNTFLLNESDYINVSKQYGKTTQYVNQFYGPDIYFSIHSNDPNLTDEWLNQQIGNVESDDGYEILVTPNMIRDTHLSDVYTEIISNIIILVVMLVIMSICMYFIMRSSIMNRIKEIGIYRAIGVSRNNFLFKYLIETIVITTLTIFIGYLIASGFIYMCLNISELIKDVFYYPWFIAFIVLIILYAISIICGVLPLFTLLKKTPSEILSKYDI